MSKMFLASTPVNRTRRSLLAFGLLAPSIPWTSPAVAQVWPQRPVKFVLPLGPGSGADIGARLLADRLTARWGQPVVVENRPGGDAIVAISTFVNAHDDYVLLCSPTSAFTAHPYLHENLPYKPSDLLPIARVSNTIITLAVPASLNVGSVADLVALARAAGQAELGGGNRRARLSVRRVPQARRSEHDQGAVS